jgi:TonB family protein
MNINVFTLKLAESFYHVSYLDYLNYSEDVEFAKKSLDAGRDGMLARNKSMKLLGERQITFGSFLGREFLILQDKFSFGIIRTFIIRGRLYEVGMLVPADAAFRNGRATARAEDRLEQFNLTANRFFNSFEPADAMESLGEVERMVRELAKKHQGIVTMVGSAEPPTQHPVTRGVINGKAVHLVTPTYPAIARSAHAAGQVSVEVLIDLDGNVAAAQVVDGHPLLRVAAIKAARESKFTPTQMEGKPVMVLGVIIYNFVAQ